MDFRTPEGIDAYEKMLAAARTGVRAEDQPSQRPVTAGPGIYAAAGKKL